jgi:hypothetical protein
MRRSKPDQSFLFDSAFPQGLNRLLKNSGIRIEIWRGFPRGLKPELILRVYVRAEARTLHLVEFFRSL